MEINRNISTTQLTWIVGTLVGLVMAVFMGSAVGNADFRMVSIVLGAGVGVGTFLALGKNYWMLIPFSLGASFPVLPLGGRSLEFPELAIAGCSLFFLMRLAGRKEKLVVFRSVNVPILLFVAWVGMVFALYPVGFAGLGSAQGGGRFYFKLGLAFAAFLVMSNRTYSERDIKWIFVFLIFGAFFILVSDFATVVLGGPTVDPSTGMVQLEVYTWHQSLSGIAMTITFIMCAKWSPREIWGLQRPWLFAVYAICLFVALMSGKRMGMAAVIMAPLISAIMFRQYRYVVVALLLSLAASGVLVAGQGQWFKLPFLAQRALSWLPGDWDPELQGLAGGADEFRTELRFMANELIKQRPLLGRGFAVNISDTSTAVKMAQRGGGIDIQVAGYALGRSWHNRWLGYAADFGIPLSIIQLAIFISILVVSYRVFKDNPKGSYFAIFGAYVFLVTCKDVVASWTSGHTAIDAFQRWWYFGVVIALYLTTRKLTKPRATSAKSALAHRPNHSVAWQHHSL